RIPLWPETVAAVKAWLAIRKEPWREEYSGLLFLTKYRLPWVRQGKVVEREDGTAKAKGGDDAIGKALRKVLDRLGLKGHRNFYALRHSFETIAGDSGDQVATNAIMGHADQSMAGHYRERIADARLKAVTDHVRVWLFAGTQIAFPGKAH